MKSKGLLIGVGIVIVMVVSWVAISGSFYYPVYEDGEIYLLELVIFDRISGNIIGNPDFTPSFDHVTEESFENRLKEEFELMGQSYEIVRAKELEDNWASSAYRIDDTIYLSYAEGFIVLYLDSYEEHKTMFHHVIRSLEYVLLNDRQLEIFPSQEMPDTFDAYNQYYFPGTVDFRFNHEDKYTVQIEDMKMGH